MSKAYKTKRKAARAKVRAVLYQADAEVRASWKKPPLLVRFMNWLKPGATHAWVLDREQDHRRQLSYAFRNTAKHLMDAERKQ